MRFSVWFDMSQSWDHLLDGVRHAEDTGWDGVYVADHFMVDDRSGFPPRTGVLEATACIAAIASVTSRVRLAPLVLSVTHRHPAVVANWAATVDHVSGGRLTLGVGAGWQENEHRQYGIPLGSPRERVDRFAEAVAVLRGLLDQEATTTAGQHYRLSGAMAEPKPVQARLPLLIGGKRDRMLGVVARWADQWNLWSTPDVLAERRRVLHRRCEEIERDPRAIGISTQALFHVLERDTDAGTLGGASRSHPVVAGTPEHISEVTAAWSDAGADELIVPDVSLGTGRRRSDALDAIIERVAPAFR